MNDDPRIGYAQTFGPVAVPGASVPKSSWQPDYPDFARAAVLLVAAIPSFFAPTRLPATFNPATIAGDLVCAPSYIYRAPTNMASRLGAPTRRPVCKSVGVNYPVRLPPISPSASLAPATFWSTFTPAVEVTPTGWAPTYPDQIARLALVPTGWYTKPSDAPDVTRFGWRGNAPDQVFTRELVREGTVVSPPLPPDTSRLGWRGRQPEWLPPTYVQPTGWITAAPPPPDTSRLGWRGSYPDQVFRRELVPEGWYARPILPPDVTRYQWRGEQPAWLPLPRATQPPSTVFDPLPRPATIQLGWEAIYPDWLPERRAVGVGLWTGPTQPPQLVPLSWSPEYPDQVFRVRALDTGTTAYQPLIQAPQILWYPSYPDWLPLPRPVNPGWFALYDRPLVSFGWATLPALLPVVPPSHNLGWIVRPQNEPPDIAKLAWHPVAPDWLQHLRPVVGPYLVVDPFPRPPAAPTYGWVAIYPSFLPPPTLVPAGLFVSIIEPIAPTPVTTIGVEAQAGLGQKKSFSITGELGGGGW